MPARRNQLGASDKGEDNRKRIARNLNEQMRSGINVQLHPA
jgi:hypothetical protein